MYYPSGQIGKINFMVSNSLVFSYPSKSNHFKLLTFIGYNHCIWLHRPTHSEEPKQFFYITLIMQYIVKAIYYCDRYITLIWICHTHSLKVFFTFEKGSTHYLLQYPVSNSGLHQMLPRGKKDPSVKDWWVYCRDFCKAYLVELDDVRFDSIISQKLSFSPNLFMIPWI